MRIIKTKEELNSIKDKMIGFVPTMGNLHAGHESLICKSKKENEITILSIYINPTQFNENRDYLNYPRTIEADLDFAEKLQVDYVFMPDYDLVYPDNFAYKIINEDKFSKILEGEYRPNHFTGVLTIVMKLLLLVKPNKAYFGEKDYQQYYLVKKMCEAFFLDTEIMLCETIRNNDGLALSSRNNLLSQEGLNRAAILYQLISSDLNDSEIEKLLAKNNIECEYIKTLEDRRFAAIRVENVRLIDNVWVKK